MTQNVIDRPKERTAGRGDAAGAAPADAPAVFRQQQRFWDEIRRRIVERNPGVREGIERLY